MPRNRSKYPEKLLPSSDLRAEWRESAEHLGVDSRGYSAKWLRFWKGVLDELRDQGTWEDRDVRLLAEYVEWVRKADFHAVRANADPYRVHSDSGRTFAHPGFKLEQEARREARVVADLLLLGADLDAFDGESDDGPPANPA